MLRRVKARKTTGGYRYVIDVTCPHCHQARTIDYQQRTGRLPLCNTGYQYPCTHCAQGVAAARRREAA